jgi:hypothetical protein
VADVEHVRDVAAAELARSSEVWAEERSWVRGQLHELASAVEDVRPDGSVEPKLQELAARVEAMEHGHQAVGSEVVRIAAAWTAEREALKNQLDALAASVTTTDGAHPAVQPESPDERLLADLVARLDEMERDGSAVNAELARVEAYWTSEIASLETRLQEVAGAASGSAMPAGSGSEERLEELARRLDTVEHDRERVGASSPADVEELRDIRVFINGLRMRLASNEKELAALSGSGDIVGRLDDVSTRLGMLERVAAAPAPAPAAPMPGDGRFRVELRGLELRMQQLEASARENRDAVLMQFERLASRLQWRLQQLELESSDQGYGNGNGATASAPQQLGQVVPIRGEG